MNKQQRRLISFAGTCGIRELKEGADFKTAAVCGLSQAYESAYEGLGFGPSAVRGLPRVGALALVEEDMMASIASWIGHVLNQVCYPPKPFKISDIKML